MILREAKQDMWERRVSFYGRYKSHKVEIVQNNNGWYVLVGNKKTDEMYNSLWDNLSFDTVESAREWSIGWIDEK